MRALLELALSNAVVALVPAALAIVVGLCCRRPALVHALWLLVLIKMLTPPLVRVSLPWPADPARPAAPAALAADEEPGAEAAAPDPEDDGEGQAPPEVLRLFDKEERLVEAPPPADEPGRAASAWRADWAEGLGWVWLVGSASWFALAVRRARAFSLALRHATPAPAELTSRLAELAGLVGLSRPPRALMVPGRVTPMV